MIAPRIDDQYWFDYSKELIDGSISRLDASIGNLKAYIKGLLIVYSTAAIFTIEYKEIEELWLLILFSLPYIIVLFGEWFTTSSTLPVTHSFDYRIPQAIEDAYMDGYKFKERMLRISVVISFLATVIVAITLMLGFIIGNKNLAIKRAEEKRTSEAAEKNKGYYLDGVFSKVERKLAVSGKFPPKSEIKINITFTSIRDTLRAPVFVRMNSRSGLYFEDFDVKSGYKKAVVDLQWSESEQKCSIIKVFSLE